MATPFVSNAVRTSRARFNGVGTLVRQGLTLSAERDPLGEPDLDCEGGDAAKCLCARRAASHAGCCASLLTRSPHACRRAFIAVQVAACSLSTARGACSMCTCLMTARAASVCHSSFASCERCVNACSGSAPLAGCARIRLCACPRMFLLLDSHTAHTLRGRRYHSGATPSAGGGAGWRFQLEVPDARTRVAAAAHTHARAHTLPSLDSPLTAEPRGCTRRRLTRPCTCALPAQRGQPSFLQPRGRVPPAQGRATVGRGGTGCWHQCDTGRRARARARRAFRVLGCHADDAVTLAGTLRPRPQRGHCCDVAERAASCARCAAASTPTHEKKCAQTKDSARTARAGAARHVARRGRARERALPGARAAALRARRQGRH